MKHFNGICIITRDVPRLCRFYSAALQAKAEGDEAYGFVQTEGASLSFYGEPGMEHMAPGAMQGAGTGSFILEVQVEDVDQEYARMVALGAPVVKPPTTQTWGWRSAWFRDPDGNILNFCAPVAQENPAPGSQETQEKTSGN
jgi:predicted enzyme related to lactoylglutathione lyase